jgi:delta(3,5)-delta(2,4)-dienoyl-CoA isomerase
VIGVGHGYCIGAGVDLLSACDIRICAEDAKFTIKEVDIGICADIGTIQRFQKIVGNDSWTRELCYTARFFSATEAMKYGFVSSVHKSKEEALAAAEKLAITIASKSQVAINVTKRSLVYSRDHTVAEGLDHIKTLNGVML